MTEQELQKQLSDLQRDSHCLNVFVMVGAGLGSVVFFSAWIVLGVFGHVENSRDLMDLKRWSQVGDAVAPFGSLIAILALIATVLSSRIQAKEVGLQAIEIRKGAEAQKEMADQMARQAAESYFESALKEFARLDPIVRNLRSRAEQVTTGLKRNSAASHAKLSGDESEPPHLENPTESLYSTKKEEALAARIQIIEDVLSRALQAQNLVEHARSLVHGQSQPQETRSALQNAVDSCVKLDRLAQVVDSHWGTLQKLGGNPEPYRAVALALQGE